MNVRSLIFTDWEHIDLSSTDAVTVDFDWKKVKPRPYRPWNNGPHFVTMGKRFWAPRFKTQGLY